MADNNAFGVENRTSTPKSPEVAAMFAKWKKANNARNNDKGSNGKSYTFKPKNA